MEAKILVLEADLKAAIEKKDALAKQAADCERKLANAEKLIGGLGGERTRWISNIASLEVDIKNVVGDVCVAAGAIAYTGPFTPSYRDKFNKDWVRLVGELKVLYLDFKYTHSLPFLKDNNKISLKDNFHRFI